jgi:hypothetical protein
MATGDRMGRGGFIASAFGPLVMPSRRAIVDALIRMAEAGPAARVGLSFHPRGAGWSWDPARLAETCEASVTIVPPIEPAAVGDALCGYTRHLDTTRPLQYLIAGDYLIQLFDHSIGDSAILLGLPAAILGVAAGGELPEWITAPEDRRPLRLAIEHTFARHPGRIPAMLAARREPGTEARIGTARPARPRRPGTLARATEPWQPQLEFAYAMGSRESAREIRAWSREHHSGASFTAMMMVLLRRSLETHGIPVAPTSTLVYDLRRYLPPGATTLGNFITGIPLLVEDPDDPEQLEHRIRQTVNTARPLAALAAGTFKYRAGLVRPWVRGPSAGDPVAQLVLSNVGVSRTLQMMPWDRAAGTPLQAVFGVRSVGAEQVSVLMSLLDADLHVTATFHGNVFEPEVVRDALRQFAEHPETLLRGRADD